jgi:hypothetical protein
VSKRTEIVKERLDPRDEVKFSWSGELDGKGGYLIMSNKRLVFVHEFGLLSKKYEIPLDLPYEKVANIEKAGRNKIVLTGTGEEKHSFVGRDVPMSSVESSLRALIEASKKP